MPTGQVLLHPLTLTSIAAATLGLLLALVLAAIRSNQRLRWRLDEIERRVGRQLDDQQAALASLRAELEAARTPAPATSNPPGGGSNLTRRSRALRMHHSGESPEKIASSLGMSRSEVDLLLKVHRTLAARL